MEFVGGPVLNRLDCKPDDVGSKCKEDVGREGTEGALIDVRLLELHRQVKTFVCTAHILASVIQRHIEELRFKALRKASPKCPYGWIKLQRSTRRYPDH